MIATVHILSVPNAGYIVFNISKEMWYDCMINMRQLSTYYRNDQDVNIYKSMLSLPQETKSMPYRLLQKAMVKLILNIPKKIPNSRICNMKEQYKEPS